MAGPPSVPVQLSLAVSRAQKLFTGNRAPYGRISSLQLLMKDCFYIEPLCTVGTLGKDARAGDVELTACWSIAEPYTGNYPGRMRVVYARHGCEHMLAIDQNTLA
uniref:Uncharacterized protein n=1 Tax=Anopheles maculatus TaxID=74869 RepID=A0A182T6W8_9DIPT